MYEGLVTLLLGLFAIGTLCPSLFMFSVAWALLMLFAAPCVVFPASTSLSVHFIQNINFKNLYSQEYKSYLNFFSSLQKSTLQKQSLKLCT